MPRLLKILAINLALLLGGLALVELFFGDWFGGDGLNRLNVPRSITLKYDAGHLFPGGGQVVYSRDKYGLRGAYGTPDKIELLTIGGSTTNQIYLSEGRTFQDRLAGLFAAEGRPLAVANAGIDGQTSIGHLRAFDIWFSHIPGLKPKWILVYLGLNDVLLESPTHADRLDSFTTWNQQIRRKSAIYHLIRTIGGAIQANRGRVVHSKLDLAAEKWTDRPSREDWQAAYGERLAAYRGRVAELATRIRALGARPIFMTQTRADFRRASDGRLEGVAWDKPPNGVDWGILVALFNAETLKVCAETGAICFDLARELEFGPGDFYDQLHNTPAGAEKIARYLHAKLKPLL